ncbi:hypothetical protein EV694_0504 [Volucribacter psittacicida]|uniref:Lipoprotein n=1 Tax=Volucribacter psittacicida TaxID=203482 RepID=A0A4R1G5S1_9PAST|nr:hypothetical protein [Volucribacter psittacicida]TCK01870.1 hypothetical protein EV694_0504 [Volucribacter psittacicida]
MKKIIIILLAIFILQGCILATVFPNDYYKCSSLSGWCKDKPERELYSWDINKIEMEKLRTYARENNITTFDAWLSKRKQDMKTCGMDFVSGYSNDIKVNLCLEQKGWYQKGGPYCENELRWDNPLCIEWRAKHSKPNAKPWG